MKNSCAHAIAKTTQVVAQNYTLVIVCGSIGTPPSFEPYYPLVNVYSLLWISPSWSSAHQLLWAIYNNQWPEARKNTFQFPISATIRLLLVTYQKRYPHEIFSFPLVEKGPCIPHFPTLRTSPLTILLENVHCKYPITDISPNLASHLTQIQLIIIILKLSG